MIIGIVFVYFFVNNYILLELIIVLLFLLKYKIKNIRFYEIVEFM